MKIYTDSYYCFGCGRSGDIFTFVQEMEGLTFKEVFQALGGVYQKPTFSSDLVIYRSRKKREMEKKKEDKERLNVQLNIALIEAYRKILKKAEPLSNTWCDALRLLQMQLYIHGEIHGIPY